MIRRPLSFLLISTVLLLFIACGPTPHDTEPLQVAPPIYPDYADVTIPCNIAPLNFLLREEVEAVEAIATCGHQQIRYANKGNEVCFDLGDWKAFMQQAAGKKVEVTISVRKEGKWYRYLPFVWFVVNEKIDPYLTYRLIEPDFEVFSHLTIRERCLENWAERPISDYRLTGDRCMNCHTYSNQQPDLSMLYVRGEGGGAILNQQGQLSKLNIKTKDMVSGSVYFGFSPNGRYITFSTNIIIPAFHSVPSKRLEVFDSASDVYVADLQTNSILRSDLLCDSTAFETFPTFSPDGHYLYFCTAGKVDLPDDLKKMKYSLCRISFDEQTGQLGEKVDTIVRAGNGKTSVCHPRISPDGNYLLYTVADYGTFPIWHPETDLRLLHLKTGVTDTLGIVNSEKSDTYHSWSSSSRWFVFASKRDDGLYGKPYFCYVDKAGKAHKPFVLPQKHPAFYDDCLKSFNAPELGTGPLPFTAADVAHALKSQGIDFK